MAVLPIVTPPFVIALALVVLFGRTGLITSWLNTLFDLPRTRWIYGLTGVTLAQLLSFTPIAFMILSGALAAVSPSLEEAAQTLRASRARVFRTVTWPLLRPALANSLPARLRRKPGRLRQPGRARRQLRGAVDQDLLRRGRRAARARPRCRAGHRAAGLHARRLLAAAALARQGELCQRQRQGRLGAAGAVAGWLAPRLRRFCDGLDRLHAGLLCRDPRRRLRQGHRPRRHDAGDRALQGRLCDRVARRRAGLRRLGVEQLSSPPSKWRRSPRR